MATPVLERLDGVKDTVADDIARVARKVRSSTPDSGVIGTAGNVVAHGLTTAQNFISDRSTVELASALLMWTRRYPLVAGAGILFLAVRKFRAFRAARRATLQPA